MSTTQQRDNLRRLRETGWDHHGIQFTPQLLCWEDSHNVRGKLLLPGKLVIPRILAMVEQNGQ